MVEERIETSCLVVVILMGKNKVTSLSYPLLFSHYGHEKQLQPHLFIVSVVQSTTCPPRGLSRTVGSCRERLILTHVTSIYTLRCHLTSLELSHVVTKDCSRLDGLEPLVSSRPMSLAWQGKNATIPFSKSFFRVNSHQRLSI